MKEELKLKQKKPVSGTKEWASKNVNFIYGCQNDCRYCYAKSMAVRFGRKTAEDWHVEEVKLDKIPKRFSKMNGQIMIPSSHDISPENVDYAIEVLGSVLKAGNKVLIVSKPHLEVVQKLCKHFKMYKKQILFRFTIGSADDKVLKFWEPGAPSFNERLKALKLAHSQGFQTCVSIEPALDGETFALVQKLSPYVTDGLWVGLVNRLKGTLKLNGHGDAETFARAEDLKKIQTDSWVYELADKLADNPKIRWKDSCKKILSMELVTEAGLDM